MDCLLVVAVAGLSPDCAALAVAIWRDRPDYAQRGNADLCRGEMAAGHI